MLNPVFASVLMQYIVPQYMAPYLCCHRPGAEVLVIVRSKHGSPYEFLIPNYP